MSNFCAGLRWELGFRLTEQSETFVGGGLGLIGTGGGAGVPGGEQELIPRLIQKSVP